MVKEFERVEKGMEKAQVIDIVGSPNRTQRWRGMDRWTYIFYDSQLQAVREVHFDQGKAAYVGAQYVPQVSAEQQDLLNENANREVDARFQRGRSGPSRGLEDYENELRGTEDNPAYVPSFEPVQ